MKRTLISSIEGKTISRVTMSPKGDYVLWDNEGKVILVCGNSRCFDSEGYFFEDTILQSTMGEDGLHKL